MRRPVSKAVAGCLWAMHRLPCMPTGQGCHHNPSFLLFLTAMQTPLPRVPGIAGLSNATVVASHFRTYHTPLGKQSDFIEALAAARRFAEEAGDALGFEV